MFCTFVFDVFFECVCVIRTNTLCSPLSSKVMLVLL
uniref:Uncharacterized protein n=1 Tax=Anguilla anguilla TaxID=7936 RepID=A0A0E9W0A9_ANGAN